MARKRKHGGRRPGAGRPVTLGIDASRPIKFHVSPADRERGETLAAAEAISVGELARHAYLERIGRRQLLLRRPRLPPRQAVSRASQVTSATPQKGEP